MPADGYPRMMRVRQRYPANKRLDVRETVARELTRVAGRIKRGMRIAVGTGSRGITNILPIVESTVQFLKEMGAVPFIVPAMGSHGGATPEGQLEVLASYGITEARLGVPIEADMDALQLGTTEEGWPAFFSAPAMKADGVIAINRVKPHTDFRSDTIGSGVLKMLVIGFGKRTGAANYHRTALHHGFEPVLRSIARLIVRSAPILCGLAIIEDQLHQTVELAALAPEELESGEASLFARAKSLMPRLPFEEIDLLIVDRIGKNISGSGMDPNIIGREVHGYSTSFEAQRKLSPVIHRLFVRDLTPETHGNAIGIGLADITTTRLARAMDSSKTNINALTSLTPNCAKVPIHFDSDREAIDRALDTLGLASFTEARVVRIADTLSLERIGVSEGFLASLAGRRDLEAEGQLAIMEFDSQGNLTDL